MNNFKQEASETEQRKMKKTKKTKRVCDYCGVYMALLYCRADSAKLCFTCDREVHSANQLFMKHTRSQLCDNCDEAPASIYCSTETSVLCQNCDWESHRNSSSAASVHDRRPVEGFAGSPGVNELLGFMGFEDLDKKGLVFNGGGGGGFGFGAEGFEDFAVWDTPSVVCLDDLIVSDQSHKFQDLGVPPLPKNRNAKCGRHKEETLSQLRVVAKSEPNLMNEDVDLNSFMSFEQDGEQEHMQSGGFCAGFEQDAEPLAFPAYEELEVNDCGKSANEDVLHRGLKRSYLNQDSLMVPDLNSNNDATASHTSDGFGGQPMISEASSAFLKVPSHECALNRESALTRYKEKKKTRRYDKHIRYESRKVRAESRTRIRGRFAKIDN